MSFWAYMLHCRGGYFYVGHTDDIDRRIGEHKSGLIPGFTADHQPVELVWNDQFMSRDDAKAAERRIKGWSLAKKLALIRGDWDRISALAKEKGSASTSSAWTGGGKGRPSKPEHTPEVKQPPNPACPELVEGPSFPLWPHPSAGSKTVKRVDASIRLIRADLIELNFIVEAPNGTLALPLGSGARRDQLWKATCFELFIGKTDSEGYREFNFSPGGDWAAYGFSGYREGQHNLAVAAAPSIEVSTGETRLTARIRLSIDDLEPGDPVGICMVMEETGFGNSYWAISHAGPQPDFHHPACFAAALPPPQRT